MSNKQEQFSIIGQKADLTSCRAKVIGKSSLVACLTEIHTCCCRFPIGTGKFCAHPLNSMIAQSELQSA